TLIMTTKHRQKPATGMPDESNRPQKPSHNREKRSAMSAKEPVSPSVLAELAARAGAADAEPRWPAASWEAVRRSGALTWAIPRPYGGAGLAPLDLLAGYEALAGACLTSCFILSQRDAACRRLRDSGNEALCRELLPPLASGEHFATVGLS